MSTEYKIRTDLGYVVYAPFEEEPVHYVENSLDATVWDNLQSAMEVVNFEALWPENSQIINEGNQHVFDEFGHRILNY